MKRALCSLAASVLALAALAAPAPQPFVAGWGNPIDPDRNCKIKREKDTLIIEMPGTIHDYDHHRMRKNAPRIVREFEGDFEMQVRVRIDCRISAESSFKGQSSYVSAGFLIIPPEKFGTAMIRSEYRVAGQGDGVDGCIAHIDQGTVSGGQYSVGPSKHHPAWPFKGKPNYVYLRLVRWRESLTCQISPDLKKWFSVGGATMSGLPFKLKVGLLACSTSTDLSKVIFDELKITRGKKMEPWEFVSAWSNPVDPDKDCKIKRVKDSLVIEMPGALHDYDPICKRHNAPRLLVDLKGDFDLQVRVRIDYRPSKKSTAEGQPSFVSGGFLFMYPDTGCNISDRLEFAVSQSGNKPDSYATPPYLARPRRNAPAPKGMEANSYVIAKCLQCERWNADRIEWSNEMQKQFANGALWDRGWQNWPLPDKADCAYLRLEQRDHWYCFLISPDGEKWTRLVSYRQSPLEKRKLALAAYSTSPEPSKVRFDQLKLWQRDKKTQQ